MRSRLPWNLRGLGIVSSEGARSAPTTTMVAAPAPAPTATSTPAPAPAPTPTVSAPAPAPTQTSTVAPMNLVRSESSSLVAAEPRTVTERVVVREVIREPTVTQQQQLPINLTTGTGQETFIAAQPRMSPWGWVGAGLGISAFLFALLRKP